MFRGYNSGQVLREDIIERVKYLPDSIEKLKKEAAVIEERIQRQKKELGTTDPPKPEGDNPNCAGSGPTPTLSLWTSSDSSTKQTP